MATITLDWLHMIALLGAQTILVLITDLFEGGDAVEMRKRVAAIVQGGTTVICLLALNDDGAPGFDWGNAAAFAALGVPTFACTPDLFPDLMAAAIQKRDIGLWAARHEIEAARAGGVGASIFEIPSVRISKIGARRGNSRG